MQAKPVKLSDKLIFAFFCIKHCAFTGWSKFQAEKALSGGHSDRREIVQAMNNTLTMQITLITFLFFP